MALGNDVRFAYESLGGASVGNFLDCVDIGTSLAAPAMSPTAAAALALALGLLGAYALSRRRRA